MLEKVTSPKIPFQSYIVIGKFLQFAVRIYTSLGNFAHIPYIHKQYKYVYAQFILVTMS